MLGENTRNSMHLITLRRVATMSVSIYCSQKKRWVRYFLIKLLSTIILLSSWSSVKIKRTIFCYISASGLMRLAATLLGGNALIARSGMLLKIFIFPRVDNQFGTNNVLLITNGENEMRSVNVLLSKNPKPILG